MSQFSHLDDSGRLRMVDVSAKPVTQRRARARGRVEASPETIAQIRNNRLAKGNVLETARLAGIMAAKTTGQWIPLCHPLVLSHVEVECQGHRHRCGNRSDDPGRGEDGG